MSVGQLTTPYDIDQTHRLYREEPLATLEPVRGTDAGLQGCMPRLFLSFSILYERTGAQGKHRS